MQKKGLPKVISPAWLRHHGACQKQVKRFLRIWPKGAEITDTNIFQASRDGLGLPFLVRVFTALGLVSSIRATQYCARSQDLRGQEKIARREACLAFGGTPLVYKRCIKAARATRVAAQAVEFKKLVEEIRAKERKGCQRYRK